MVTVGEPVSHGLVLDAYSEALSGQAPRRKAAASAHPSLLPPSAPTLRELSVKRGEQRCSCNTGVLWKKASAARGEGTGKPAEEYFQDHFLVSSFL